MFSAGKKRPKPLARLGFWFVADSARRVLYAGPVGPAGGVTAAAGSFFARCGSRSTRLARSQAWSFSGWMRICCRMWD